MVMQSQIGAIANYVRAYARTAELNSLMLCFEAAAAEAMDVITYVGSPDLAQLLVTYVHTYCSACSTLIALAHRGSPQCNFAHGSYVRGSVHG